jgi:hypothetical protein
MAYHHEVTINRKDDHAIPSDCPAMIIGDTVRYSSPDGEVQLRFIAAPGQPTLPASPFGANEIITGSALQSVTTEGVFEVRCFVKKPGESDFKGWDKMRSPKSGGVFPVKPN